MTRFRLRRHVSPSIFLVTAFCVVIFQRNVFNADASANGAFQSSNAAFLIAASTIAFIALSGLVYRAYFFKVSANLVMVSILSFYIFAAATAIASSLPILSAFRALSGLGLVLAAAAYGKHAAAKHGPQFTQHFFAFAAVVGAAYVIGTIMFQTRVLGGAALPVRGGLSAAIFFGLALWKWLDFRKSKQFSDLMLCAGLSVFALSLYSASAVIAVIGTALSLLIINRKYVLFLSGIAAMIVSASLFYGYLLNDLDAIIFNKPARAFLIGTGRFPLYEFAIQLYTQEFSLLRQLIGVGFMAEREYLTSSNLSWTSNLHNSVLSNLLGVGLIGFVLCVAFIILPFLQLTSVRRHFGSLVANKWISLHLVFVFFGFTSIDYPSSPSWLMVLFIVLSSGLFAQRASGRSDAR